MSGQQGEDTLINPADPPDRQREKLLTIARVLMRRVEQITDDGGAAYAQFQRAAMLEDQVSLRMRELERTVDLLNASNAALEAANRETEIARTNLAMAIETVQEGFGLFDAKDVLVLCNSRFGMHMSDVQPQIAPGLHFDTYVDLVSRSTSLTLPDGMQPEAWAVARKRRHADQHVIFNVQMKRDHWVQVSEHRTEDGGTVILQTDVTDIIRIERSERGRLLDDQARMIRATLDHLEQGVWIFDSGGQLAGWNARLGGLLPIVLPRLRLGASAERLVARICEDSDLTGIDRRALTDWMEGHHGRAPIRFEVARRRDGQVVTVFAQELPDGGFVMSFVDVTTERRAGEALQRAKDTLEARVVDRTLELEDALDQAERANAGRSRFVAAASHDLLQPLSAAKLFLSSVPEDSLPPQTAEALSKAQNALLSVEGIVEALLDISRLESGKASLSVGPVRLDRLLRQLVQEFLPVAEAKGLRLHLRAPPNVMVQSDATYLRRILQNLIGNAIRYTDKGGVLVAARMRGKAVLRLEVWDSGLGIAEEEQDNIFKEFHRVAARASASEGLGLGLAIVERACALLGHPLALYSRLGRGSVFMVQVPVLDAPTQIEPASLGARADVVGGQIVLLVENDADLRRALVLLLERWGADVLESASAEEARALLEELGIFPDLVIADQRLGPGGSGLDLIKGLRHMRPNMPARLISADRSAALHAAAQAAGVEVLVKPVDPQRLRHFIATAPAPTTKGP